MATHIVTISASNERPKPLTIVDDEGHEAHTKEEDERLTTVVSPGDTVKFQIKKGCGIQSIDAIKRIKANGPWSKVVDFMWVFKKAPHKNPDGSWQVPILSMGPLDGHTVSYTIAYTVNGEKFIEDPKIAIHGRKAT